MPTQDVALGYLANSPTTCAVLAALRKAQKARQAIKQGSVTARVQTATVSAPAWAEPGSATEFCKAATFSPRGRYLALICWCRRAPLTSAQQAAYTSGVVIYSLAEGFEQLHCLWGYCGQTVLCWAPETASLSIAGQRAPELSMQQPLVLVIDAPTGRTLHALGSENESMFEENCQGEENNLEWSASGQFLLISNHSTVDAGYGPYSSFERGVLTVFDVVKDELLARSGFSMELLTWYHMHAATWHPSSRGLALSNRVQLCDPAGFKSASMSIGTLPQLCFISVRPGTGFSPDGKLFLAYRAMVESETVTGEAYDKLPYIPDNSNCIMECMQQGHLLTFQIKHRLQGYGCQWLPSSSRVVRAYGTMGSIPREAYVTRLQAVQPGLSIGIRTLSCKGRSSAICHWAFHIPGN